MNVFRAIIAAGVAYGFSASLHAQLADGIKAIVHDSVITYQQVEALTAPAAEALRRQYQRTQPEVYDKKLAEILNENLEQLLERQLIIHDFKSAGYNLPEAYLDDVVQERIRTRYGDRAKLTKTLQAEGMTYEKFRQQLRDQIIVEILRFKNVAQDIIVSPHKIEAYYLAHQDEYKLEDEVRLRMIVLYVPSESEAPAVRRLAGEILGKIKEGATFAEMATIHSQGSQSHQGGDWGWVERKTLNAGLAAIAFSLKLGQLSDVISRSGTKTNFWVCEYDSAGKPTLARHFEVEVDSQTKKEKESLVEERTFPNAGDSANLPPPEEFYLMLVEDKRPAHVKPLIDVQDDIEKILLNQERTRLQKQYVDRLKKKTFVRYF
jgi:peptidyl-prolyl cis-trans isomerase SurA